MDKLFNSCMIVTVRGPFENELFCSLRKLIDHMLYYVINFDHEYMPDAEMMFHTLETSYYENDTGTRQFIHMQNAF